MRNTATPGPSAIQKRLVISRSSGSSPPRPCRTMNLCFSVHAALGARRDHPAGLRGASGRCKSFSPKTPPGRVARPRRLDACGQDRLEALRASSLPIADDGLIEERFPTVLAAEVESLPADARREGRPCRPPSCTHRIFHHPFSPPFSAVMPAFSAGSGIRELTRTAEDVKRSQKQDASGHALHFSLSDVLRFVHVGKSRAGSRFCSTVLYQRTFG